MANKPHLHEVPADDRPRGHDPFKALDTEFREQVQGLSDDEIRRKIARLAALRLDNERLKKEDPHLLRLKDQLKQEQEPYALDDKAYRLQISYAIQVLRDRGKEV